MKWLCKIGLHRWRYFRVGNAIRECRRCTRIQYVNHDKWGDSPSRNTGENQ